QGRGPCTGYGTRDVPISTLRAVIENGLGLRIDAAFTGKATRVAAIAVHPRDVELTAEAISRLPLKLRRPLLSLVCAIEADFSREAASRKHRESRAAGRPPSGEPLVDIADP